jgi:hypothetical protein
MNFQLKAPTVIGVLLFCVVTGVGVTGSAYYKSLSLKGEESFFNQVFGMSIDFYLFYDVLLF